MSMSTKVRENRKGRGEWGSLFLKKGDERSFWPVVELKVRTIGKSTQMSSDPGEKQKWVLTDWFYHSPIPQPLAGITNPSYPFLPQNSYMADIINLLSICPSEFILDFQIPWQESSQASCFMLQLNLLMFLCEWCVCFTTYDTVV